MQRRKRQGTSYRTPAGAAMQVAIETKCAAVQDTGGLVMAPFGACHTGSLHTPFDDRCRAACPNVPIAHYSRQQQLLYQISVKHLWQCLECFQPLSMHPLWAAGRQTCRVAGGGSCCRSPSTMDVPLRRWFMKRTSASRRKSCRGSHSMSALQRQPDISEAGLL